jgi:hypothetical protein
MVRGSLRFVALLAVAVSLACASSALADGGKAIAGAPTIVYGQQEFGTLGNGAVSDNGCSSPAYTEWWLLPVAAGDQVTINWGMQVTFGTPNYTGLQIYPVGTTDYTYADADTVVDQALNNNDGGADQATFTATTTGTMPVAFVSPYTTCVAASSGPYNFTAYVLHEMVLTAPAVGATLSGTADIGVHSPDGAALSSPVQVSLQVLESGVWTTIGTATALNGLAQIAYGIPSSLAGSLVSLRAVGTGSGYSQAISAAQTFALPGGVHCLVPHLVALKLRAARRTLVEFHCTVGAIHYRRKAGWGGRVIAQAIRPGRHLPDNAPIGVTIARN